MLATGQNYTAHSVTFVLGRRRDDAVPSISELTLDDEVDYDGQRSQTFANECFAHFKQTASLTCLRAPCTISA